MCIQTVSLAVQVHGLVDMNLYFLCLLLLFQTVHTCNLACYNQQHVQETQLDVSISLPLAWVVRTLVPLTLSLRNELLLLWQYESELIEVKGLVQHTKRVRFTGLVVVEPPLSDMMAGPLSSAAMSI